MPSHVMKEKDQRHFQLVKSLWEYFLLSWPIYVLILLLAVMLWAISLPEDLFINRGGVYAHWVEFLSNIAPSLVAAFLILWFTDFISREHLTKLFAQQKEGVETIQEAFDWGLKLYPSHKVINSREWVLDNYLDKGDVVRILSGRGTPWLDYDDPVLERLVAEGITTRVILFSPELYAERLLFDVKDADESNPVMQELIQRLAQKQEFSRYRATGAELIGIHRRLKISRDNLSAQQKSRITVRYTGLVPLCEFFVVGDKRSHGAVPMHTKTHRDSFSIQTFRGLRCGDDNVREFIAEFDFLWKPEHSVSEEDYFDNYAKA